MFKLNAYDDEEYLPEFHFTPGEMPTVMNLFSWNSGVRKSNRYKSSSIATTWVLLRRLWYPSCVWQASFCVKKSGQ